MKAILYALAMGLLAFASQASAENKNCGHSGQRPCLVFEDWVPGCKPNLLVNRKNVCVHPSCGAHGQSPCAPSVRVPPCDWGLTLDLQGKCVTPKEATDPKRLEMLAEIAQCKTAVSILQGRKVPPGFEPVVQELRSKAGQIQTNLKAYEKQARDYAQKNAATYKEINRVVMLLKNDANRLAAFRKLFHPDEICAPKPASERVRQLRSLGLLPDLRLIRASNGYSEPRLVRVAEGERQSLSLMFTDGLVLAFIPVQFQAVIGLVINFDFGGKPVSGGPIAILSVGGAVRAAFEQIISVRFSVAPRAELAHGSDIYVELGGGAEIPGVPVEFGGGIEATWSPGHPDPIGGAVSFEGGLSLAPVHLGAGMAWHWLLLPKSLGGAL